MFFDVTINLTLYTKEEIIYRYALHHFNPQVEIHYTASANGVLLDTSCNQKPISFTMGSGTVMEAWDRIVSTMRKAGMLGTLGNLLPVMTGDWKRSVK